MSTETLFSDGRDVIATGWTNPSNADAEDGTYATAAPAQNGVISSRFTFPASAASGAIRSIAAILKFKVSTAASIAILNVTNYNALDGTPVSVGGGSDATEPLADKTVVFPFIPVPSLADALAAGRLGVLVEAQHGNSATAVTFSLDYVALVIDYADSSGNDLAELHSQLEVALNDTGNAVWTDAEIDDILTQRAAILASVAARRYEVDVPLVGDQALYSVTGWDSINRIDLFDGDPEVATSNLLTPLAGGSWELLGDQNFPATRELFINPMFAQGGWYVRLHGYKVYDLTSNIVPDNMVPAILAMARAEAYRRMAGNRAKFEQWAALNQKESVSVNELMQMVNEAEAEAQRQKRNSRVMRMPVPATVG